jgi:hypothetical protein
VKRFLCVLALLAMFPAACLAADVKAIDITGVSDGSYMVTITGSAVSMVPLKLINPGNTPPVPPVPDPSQLTERAKAIKAAAIALNDPEMSVKMSLLMDEIAKLIDSGQIATQNKMALAMSKGQSIVLGDKVTAWKPVTSLISADWAKLVQEGAANADYAKYIREIRDGLRASAPMQAIDPKWIELIMQIIMLILSVIG